MKRRINEEELTRKLNEFRMENVGKSYLSEELTEKMMGLGFSKGDAWSIMAKAFPAEKMGTRKLYEIPKEPIHKSIISGHYNSRREAYRKSIAKAKKEALNAISEEEALKALQSKGYQIRKCVGFDVERFQKENPILYKKYLKYEII